MAIVACLPNVRASTNIRIYIRKSRLFMKKNSSSKHVQSFILAALISMTLLGGNVVTSMAQENDQQTETTNTQAVPADNTSGNVTDPEAEKDSSSDTGSGR